MHWHTAALQIPPEGFSNCALNRNTPMSSHSTVTSSQKETTTAQPSWDSRKEPVPALLTLVLLLLFSGSQQGLLPLCRRRHAGPVPPGPATRLPPQPPQPPQPPPPGRGWALPAGREAPNGRQRPRREPRRSRARPGAAQRAPARARPPARAGLAPPPPPFPFPSHRGAPAGESPSRGAAVGRRWRLGGRAL